MIHICILNWNPERRTNVLNVNLLIMKMMEGGEERKPIWQAQLQMALHPTDNTPASRERATSKLNVLHSLLSEQEADADEEVGREENVQVHSRKTF